MFTWTGLTKRLLILLVGLGTAFALLPIGMMADSGTTLANVGAGLGVYGVLLLAVGGIVGFIVKRWIALLPGAVLVLSALSIPLPPLFLVVILLLYYCLKPTRSNQGETVSLTVVDAENYIIVDVVDDDDDIKELQRCDEVKMV
jgi:hypothetical protein